MTNDILQVPTLKVLATEQDFDLVDYQEELKRIWAAKFEGKNKLASATREVLLP